MTQMQFLVACSSMISVMKKNGMRVKDIDALEMVQKAEKMEGEGLQKCYIVQHLADEYGISVRSVYSAIDRLHGNIVM